MSTWIALGILALVALVLWVFLPPRRRSEYEDVSAMHDKLIREQGPTDKEAFHREMWKRAAQSLKPPGVR